MATVALGLALGMMTNGTARADTFGSGNNTFTIDFVNVGNAGNANDVGPNGGPYGGVTNNFRIGTFEVSRDAITKANAVGNLGITLEDMGRASAALESTGLPQASPGTKRLGVTRSEGKNYD